MSFRLISTVFCAAALLGAARPAPLIVYSAPAGDRPAGADRVHPTDAILPNGRIAAPAGTSIFVGSGTLGMALSPDGRYAILSNAGSAVVAGAPPALAAGSSLSVVDTRSMRVTSVYQESGAAFFMGIAAVRDPGDGTRTLVLASDGAAGTVRLFSLDGGSLTPQGAIALPAQSGQRAFPAGIAIASDGRTAYVADNFANTVFTLDLAQRAVARAIPCGDDPLYVAAGGKAMIASGMGLSSYSPLGAPTGELQFADPDFAREKSSTLTVVEGGDGADPATVSMDRAPDGTQIVGGAAPAATVISRDGRYAYVALANVDRVAVVSLIGVPRVVRGLDLRLYPGAPYGAEPSAVALSPDGKRLYVALAGLNAVAVLDARHSTRYRFGLIPTAWYPSALTLSRDGRYLYVAGAKGVDGWGILQRVDLHHTSLVKATLAALRYNRTPAIGRFDPVIPPLRSGKRSETIDHVVYIGVAPGSYDELFGDLKDAAGTAHGNGDPTFSRYPEPVTPNLHALASGYALADNFYGADADPDVAKEFGLAAEPTLYQEMVDAAGPARVPRDDHGDDPEDYARDGFLFNALQRAGLSYRDYGGLLDVSGYDGSLYHYDTPGLAALAGNVDLAYAGGNPKVGDLSRADEFVRDMNGYVQSDREPNFTYISLPAESGSGGVTDEDRALGVIVAFISRTPHWSSTAIFIVPQGVTASSDHVNLMRTYALVVSPLVRRGFVGDAHLSVASVVKTEEEILGLPPLALDDLLASDMASFFTDAPVPEAFTAR